MTSAVQPIIIKRYANRRLYHSRTGRYVSRKDLEIMARNGEEFVVLDSATGVDITRSMSLYLEFSLLTMTNESVRKQMTQTGNSVINLIDDQVQRNIKVFETMLSAFSTDSGQTQPEQRPK